MQEIPKQLLTQAVQVIRQATHTKFDHDTIERLAQQLEGVRDDESGEFAEELQASYEELVSDEDADKELQPDDTDEEGEE